MKKWLWIVGLVAVVLGSGVRMSRSGSQLVQMPLETFPVIEGKFQRAEAGRLFSFPADHGAHLDYQTEWWYYTGNLVAEDGRLFGFQLTFFRRGLVSQSERVPRESKWAGDQIYMAHFALSWISDRRFDAFERFSREAVGLAGTQVDPLYQVWLENWKVVQVGDNQYQLFAEAGDIMLDLALQDVKGPVLQGVAGYSQKGPDPGNASYYYSQTRLLLQGKLTVQNRVLNVHGEGWMDHEFGTSTLSGNQVGWDWFALQLDEGSELMVYTIRNVNGETDPFSSGMIIRADCSTHLLKFEDFILKVTDTWKSPQTRAVYPAGWIIEVPGEELTLRVSPRLDNQELHLSFTYWEGSVEVSGEQAGKAVGGQGYAELTGYAQSMQGRF